MLRCAALTGHAAVLAGVSHVTVWGLVFMAGAVVYTSLGIVAAAPDPWKGVQPFNWSSAVMAALPILIFGFQCHCK
jgi:hypothetical protein